jgi:hypothetical protein
MGSRRAFKWPTVSMPDLLAYRPGHDPPIRASGAITRGPPSCPPWEWLIERIGASAETGGVRKTTRYGRHAITAEALDRLLKGRFWAR